MAWRGPACPQGALSTRSGDETRCNAVQLHDPHCEINGYILLPFGRRVTNRIKRQAGHVLRGHVAARHFLLGPSLGGGQR